MKPGGLCSSSDGSSTPSDGISNVSNTCKKLDDTSLYPSESTSEENSACLTPDLFEERHSAGSHSTTNGFACNNDVANGVCGSLFGGGENAVVPRDVLSPPSSEDGEDRSSLRASGTGSNISGSYLTPSTLYQGRCKTLTQGVVGSHNSTDIAESSNPSGSLSNLLEMSQPGITKHSSPVSCEAIPGSGASTSEGSHSSMCSGTESKPNVHAPKTFKIKKKCSLEEMVAKLRHRSGPSSGDVCLPNVQTCDDLGRGETVAHQDNYDISKEGPLLCRDRCVDSLNCDNPNTAMLTVSLSKDSSNKSVPSRCISGEKMDLCDSVYTDRVLASENCPATFLDETPVSENYTTIPETNMLSDRKKGHDSPNVVDLTYESESSEKSKKVCSNDEGDTNTHISGKEEVSSIRTVFTEKMDVMSNVDPMNSDNAQSRSVVLNALASLVNQKPNNASAEVISEKCSLGLAKSASSCSIRSKSASEIPSCDTGEVHTGSRVLETKSVKTCVQKLVSNIVDEESRDSGSDLEILFEKRNTDVETDTCFPKLCESDKSSCVGTSSACVKGDKNVTVQYLEPISDEENSLLCAPTPPSELSSASGIPSNSDTPLFSDTPSDASRGAIMVKISDAVAAILSDVSDDSLPPSPVDNVHKNFSNLSCLVEAEMKVSSNSDKCSGEPIVPKNDTISLIKKSGTPLNSMSCMDLKKASENNDSKEISDESDKQIRLIVPKDVSKIKSSYVDRSECSVIKSENLLESGNVVRESGSLYDKEVSEELPSLSIGRVSLDGLLNNSVVPVAGSQHQVEKSAMLKTTKCPSPLYSAASEMCTDPCNVNSLCQNPTSGTSTCTSSQHTICNILVGERKKNVVLGFNISSNCSMSESACKLDVELQSSVGSNQKDMSIHCCPVLAVPTEESDIRVPDRKVNALQQNKSLNVPGICDGSVISSSKCKEGTSEAEKLPPILGASLSSETTANVPLCDGNLQNCPSYLPDATPSIRNTASSDSSSSEPCCSVHCKSITDTRDSDCLTQNVNPASTFIDHLKNDCKSNAPSSKSKKHSCSCVETRLASGKGKSESTTESIVDLSQEVDQCKEEIPTIDMKESDCSESMNRTISNVQPESNQVSCCESLIQHPEQVNNCSEVPTESDPVTSSDFVVNDVNCAAEIRAIKIDGQLSHEIANRNAVEPADVNSNAVDGESSKDIQVSFAQKEVVVDNSCIEMGGITENILRSPGNEECQKLSVLSEDLKEDCVPKSIACRGTPIIGLEESAMRKTRVLLKVPEEEELHLFQRTKNTSCCYEDPLAAIDNNASQLCTKLADKKSSGSCEKAEMQCIIAETLVKPENSPSTILPTSGKSLVAVNPMDCVGSSAFENSTAEMVKKSYSSVTLLKTFRKHLPHGISDASISKESCEVDMLKTPLNSLVVESNEMPSLIASEEIGGDENQKSCLVPPTTESDVMVKSVTQDKTGMPDLPNPKQEITNIDIHEMSSKEQFALIENEKLVGAVTACKSTNIKKPEFPVFATNTVAVSEAEKSSSCVAEQQLESVVSKPVNTDKKINKASDKLHLLESQTIQGDNGDKESLSEIDVPEAHDTLQEVVTFKSSIIADISSNEVLGISPREAGYSQMPDGSVKLDKVEVTAPRTIPDNSVEHNKSVIDVLQDLTATPKTVVHEIQARPVVSKAGDLAKENIIISEIASQIVNRALLETNLIKEATQSVITDRGSESLLPETQVEGDKLNTIKHINTSRMAIKNDVDVESKQSGTSKVSPIVFSETQSEGCSGSVPEDMEHVKNYKPVEVAIGVDYENGQRKLSPLTLELYKSLAEDGASSSSADLFMTETVDNISKEGLSLEEKITTKVEEKLDECEFNTLSDTSRKQAFLISKETPLTETENIVKSEMEKCNASKTVDFNFFKGMEEFNTFGTTGNMTISGTSLVQFNKSDPTSYAFTVNQDSIQPKQTVKDITETEVMTAKDSTVAVTISKDSAVPGIAIANNITIAENEFSEVGTAVGIPSSGDGTVRETTLLENSSISENASLKDSVIAEKADLKKNITLSSDSIISGATPYEDHTIAGTTSSEDHTIAGTTSSDNGTIAGTTYSEDIAIAETTYSEDITIAETTSSEDHTIAGTTSSESSVIARTTSSEDHIVAGITSSEVSTITGTTSSDNSTKAGTTCSEDSKVAGITSEDITIVGTTSPDNSTISETASSEDHTIHGITSSDNNTIAGTTSTEDSSIAGTTSSEDSKVAGTISSEDSTLAGTASSNSTIAETTSSEDITLAGVTPSEDHYIAGTTSSDNSTIAGTTSSEDSSVAGTTSSEDNKVAGTTSSQDHTLDETTSSNNSTMSSSIEDITIARSAYSEDSSLASTTVSEDHTRARTTYSNNINIAETASSEYSTIAETASSEYSTICRTTFSENSTTVGSSSSDNSATAGTSSCDTSTIAETAYSENSTIARTTSSEDKTIAGTTSYGDNSLPETTSSEDSSIVQTTSFKSITISGTTSSEDGTTAGTNISEDIMIVKTASSEDSTVARTTSSEDSTVARTTSSEDSTVARTTSSEDSTVALTTSSEDSTVALTTSSEDSTVARTTSPEDSTVAQTTFSEDSTVALTTSSEDSTVALTTSSEDSTVALTTSSEDSTVALTTSSEDSTVALTTSSEDSTVALTTSSEDSTVALTTSSEDSTVALITSFEDSTVALTTSSEDSTRITSSEDSTVARTTSSEDSTVARTTSSEDSTVALTTSSEDSTVALTTSSEDSTVARTTSSEDSTVALTTSSEDSTVARTTSSEDSTVTRTTSSEDSTVTRTTSSEDSTVALTTSSEGSTVARTTSSEGSTVAGTTSSEDCTISGTASSENGTISGTASGDSTIAITTSSEDCTKVGPSSAEDNTIAGSTSSKCNALAKTASSDKEYSIVTGTEMLKDSTVAETAFSELSTVINATYSEDSNVAKTSSSDDSAITEIDSLKDIIVAEIVSSNGSTVAEISSLNDSVTAEIASLKSSTCADISSPEDMVVPLTTLQKGCIESEASSTKDNIAETRSSEYYKIAGVASTDFCAVAELAKDFSETQKDYFVMETRDEPEFTEISNKAIVVETELNETLKVEDVTETTIDPVLSNTPKEDITQKLSSPDFTQSLKETTVHELEVESSYDKASGQSLFHETQECCVEAEQTVEPSFIATSERCSVIEPEITDTSKFCPIIENKVESALDPPFKDCETEIKPAISNSAKDSQVIETVLEPTSIDISGDCTVIKTAVEHSNNKDVRETMMKPDFQDTSKDCISDEMKTDFASREGSASAQILMECLSLEPPENPITDVTVKPKSSIRSENCVVTDEMGGSPSPNMFEESMSETVLESCYHKSMADPIKCSTSSELVSNKLQETSVTDKKMLDDAVELDALSDNSNLTKIESKPVTKLSPSGRKEPPAVLESSVTKSNIELESVQIQEMSATFDTSLKSGTPDTKLNAELPIIPHGSTLTETASVLKSDEMSRKHMLKIGLECESAENPQESLKTSNLKEDYSDEILESTKMRTHSGDEACGNLPLSKCTSSKEDQLNIIAGKRDEGLCILEEESLPAKSIGSISCVPYVKDIQDFEKTSDQCITEECRTFDQDDIKNSVIGLSTTEEVQTFEILSKAVVVEPELNEISKDGVIAETNEPLGIQTEVSREQCQSSIEDCNEAVKESSMKEGFKSGNKFIDESRGNDKISEITRCVEISDGSKQSVERECLYASDTLGNCMTEDHSIVDFECKKDELFKKSIISADFTAKVGCSSVPENTESHQPLLPSSASYLRKEIPPVLESNEKTLESDKLCASTVDLSGQSFDNSMDSSIDPENIRKQESVINDTEGGSLCDFTHIPDDDKTDNDQKVEARRELLTDPLVLEQQQTVPKCSDDNMCLDERQVEQISISGEPKEKVLVSPLKSEGTSSVQVLPDSMLNHESLDVQDKRLCDNVQECFPFLALDDVEKKVAVHSEVEGSSIASGLGGRNGECLSLCIPKSPSSRVAVSISSDDLECTKSPVTIDDNSLVSSCSQSQDSIENTNICSWVSSEEVSDCTNKSGPVKEDLEDDEIKFQSEISQEIKDNTAQFNDEMESGILHSSKALKKVDAQYVLDEKLQEIKESKSEVDEVNVEESVSLLKEVVQTENKHLGVEDQEQRCGFVADSSHEANLSSKTTLESPCIDDSNAKAGGCSRGDLEENNETIGSVVDRKEKTKFVEDVTSSLASVSELKGSHAGVDLPISSIEQIPSTTGKLSSPTLCVADEARLDVKTNPKVSINNSMVINSNDASDECTSISTKDSPESVSMSKCLVVSHAPLGEDHLQAEQCHAATIADQKSNFVEDPSLLAYVHLENRSLTQNTSDDLPSGSERVAIEDHTCDESATNFCKPLVHSLDVSAPKPLELNDEGIHCETTKIVTQESKLNENVQVSVSDECALTLADNAKPETIEKSAQSNTLLNTSCDAECSDDAHKDTSELLIPVPKIEGVLERDSSTEQSGNYSEILYTESSRPACSSSHLASREDQEKYIMESCNTSCHDMQLLECLNLKRKDLLSGKCQEISNDNSAEFGAVTVDPIINKELCSGEVDGSGDVNRRQKRTLQCEAPSPRSTKRKSLQQVSDVQVRSDGLGSELKIVEVKKEVCIPSDEAFNSPEDCDGGTWKDNNIQLSSCSYSVEGGIITIGDEKKELISPNVIETVCPLCRNTLRDPLEDHIMDAHICVSFVPAKSTMSYRSHMLQRVNDEVNVLHEASREDYAYVCRNCHFSSRDINAVRCHLNLHEDVFQVRVGSVRCDCSQKPYSYQLHRWKSLIHNSQYYCYDCNYYFSCEQAMVTHLAAMHYPEKQCNICKQNVSQDEYILHSDRHRSESDTTEDMTVIPELPRTTRSKGSYGISWNIYDNSLNYLDGKYFRLGIAAKVQDRSLDRSYLALPIKNVSEEANVPDKVKLDPAKDIRKYLQGKKDIRVAEEEINEVMKNFSWLVQMNLERKTSSGPKKGKHSKAKRECELFEVLGIHTVKSRVTSSKKENTSTRDAGKSPRKKTSDGKLESSNTDISEVDVANLTRTRSGMQITRDENGDLEDEALRAFFFETKVAVNGEWSKEHTYICCSCGAGYLDLADIMDHKWERHPSVWCAHTMFQGQGSVPISFCSQFQPPTNRPQVLALASPPMKEILPGTPDGPDAKDVSLHENQENIQMKCSRCSLTFNETGVFHSHLVECGGLNQMVFVKKKNKKGFRFKRRKGQGVPNNRYGISSHPSTPMKVKSGDRSSGLNTPQLEKASATTIQSSGVKRRLELAIGSINNHELKSRLKAIITGTKSSSTNPAIPNRRTIRMKLRKKGIDKSQLRKTRHSDKVKEISKPTKGSEEEAKAGSKIEEKKVGNAAKEEKVEVDGQLSKKIVQKKGSGEVTRDKKSKPSTLHEANYVDAVKGKPTKSGGKLSSIEKKSVNSRSDNPFSGGIESTNTSSVAAELATNVMATKIKTKNSKFVSKKLKAVKKINGLLEATKQKLSGESAVPVSGDNLTVDVKKALAKKILSKQGKNATTGGNNEARNLDVSAGLMGSKEISVQKRMKQAGKLKSGKIAEPQINEQDKVTSTTITLEKPIVKKSKTSDALQNKKKGKSKLNLGKTGVISDLITAKTTKSKAMKKTLHLLSGTTSSNNKKQVPQILASKKLIKEKGKVIPKEVPPKTQPTSLLPGKTKGAAIVNDVDSINLKRSKRVMSSSSEDVDEEDSDDSEPEVIRNFRSGRGCSGRMGLRNKRQPVLSRYSFRACLEPPKVKTDPEEEMKAPHETCQTSQVSYKEPEVISEKGEEEEAISENTDATKKRKRKIANYENQDDCAYIPEDISSDSEDDYSLDAQQHPLRLRTLSRKKRKATCSDFTEENTDGTETSHSSETLCVQKGLQLSVQDELMLTKKKTQAKFKKVISLKNKKKVLNKVSKSLSRQTVASSGKDLNNHPTENIDADPNVSQLFKGKGKKLKTKDRTTKPNPKFQSEEVPGSVHLSNTNLSQPDSKALIIMGKGKSSKLQSSVMISNSKFSSKNLSKTASKKPSKSQKETLTSLVTSSTLITAEAPNHLLDPVKTNRKIPQKIKERSSSISLGNLSRAGEQKKNVKAMKKCSSMSNLPQGLSKESTSEQYAWKHSLSRCHTSSDITSENLCEAGTVTPLIASVPSLLRCTKNMARFKNRGNKLISLKTVQKQGYRVDSPLIVSKNSMIKDELVSELTDSTLTNEEISAEQAVKRKKRSRIVMEVDNLEKTECLVESNIISQPLRRTARKRSTNGSVLNVSEPSEIGHAVVAKVADAPVVATVESPLLIEQVPNEKQVVNKGKIVRSSKKRKSTAAQDSTANVPVVSETLEASSYSFGEGEGARQKSKLLGSGDDTVQSKLSNENNCRSRKRKLPSKVSSATNLGNVVNQSTEVNDAFVPSKKAKKFVEKKPHLKSSCNTSKTSKGKRNSQCDRLGNNHLLNKRANRGSNSNLRPQSKALDKGIDPEVKPKTTRTQKDKKENTVPLDAMPILEPMNVVHSRVDAPLVDNSGDEESLSNISARIKRRRSSTEKIKNIPTRSSAGIGVQESPSPPHLQAFIDEQVSENQSDVIIEEERLESPNAIKPSPKLRRRRTQSSHEIQVKEKLDVRQGPLAALSEFVSNCNDKAEKSVISPIVKKPAVRRRAVSTSELRKKENQNHPHQPKPDTSIAKEKVSNCVVGKSKKASHKKESNNKKKDSNDLKCLDCGLRFDSFASLEDHQQDCITIALEMSLMEAEDHLYECQHCHLTFAMKGTHKQHTASCRLSKYKRPPQKHESKLRRKASGRMLNSQVLNAPATNSDQVLSSPVETPSKELKDSSKKSDKSDSHSTKCISQTIPEVPDSVTSNLKEQDLPENVLLSVAGSSKGSSVHELSLTKPKGSPKLRRRSRANGKVRHDVTEPVSPNIASEDKCVVCGCEIKDDEMSSKHLLLEQFAHSCQQQPILEVCVLLAYYNLSVETVRSLVTSAIFYQDSTILKLDAKQQTSPDLDPCLSPSENKNKSASQLLRILASPHCMWVSSVLEAIANHYYSVEAVSISGTRQEALNAVSVLEDLFKEIENIDSTIRKNQMLRTMKETFEAGTL